VIVENAGYGATWAGPIAGLMMEKYLNDTLTKESQLKADNLSKVDLLPQAVKDWYVRHNKAAYLTPLEYNNDELSDVWDMEMVSSEAVPAIRKVDTAKKDSVKVDSAKKAAIPIPAIPKTNLKANKLGVLPKGLKIKKKLIKKNVHHQQPK
jgi:penicillin-binding protein 2